MRFCQIKYRSGQFIVMLLAFFYQVRFCGLCQICVRGYGGNKRIGAFQYQIVYHRYQVAWEDPLRLIQDWFSINCTISGHLSLPGQLS